MDTSVIFIVGVFVTLLVGAAFAMLIWAELEDGRTQRAAERGEPHDLSETDAERPIARVF